MFRRLCAMHLTLKQHDARLCLPLSSMPSQMHRARASKDSVRPHGAFAMQARFPWAAPASANGLHPAGRELLRLLCALRHLCKT